jgi:hypothetical protein
MGHFKTDNFLSVSKGSKTIDSNEYSANMKLDERFGIPVVKSHCLGCFKCLKFNQNTIFDESTIPEKIAFIIPVEIRFHCVLMSLETELLWIEPFSFSREMRKKLKVLEVGADFLDPARSG